MFRTETRLVDPNRVYETMLELSEWEFKKDAIARAGDDFTANATTAAHLGLVVIAMVLLMVGEIGCFTAWTVETAPNIPRVVI